MGLVKYYTPDQFFSVILFTTLIIFVVITFMFTLYKVEQRKITIIILGITLLVSLLCAFASQIVYSRNVATLSDYISFIGIILYLITNIILILKNHESKQSILLTFFILLLIPTLFSIRAELETNIILALYTLHYILIYNKFKKYKVGSSLFNDAKKLMLDYVYIISANGDVIFKNDKVVNSNVFSNEGHVDTGKIDGLFNYKITMRNAFSIQFIKAEVNRNLYFQYHKKEIMDKGNLAGYILTFVDITQLIYMLDELSEKKEQTRKTNIELNKYKEIVYDIEKEKEINTLLDEIANNHQKSMCQLKNSLEKLNVSDERFLDNLDDISLKAKLNLKDVRESVTSFIKYYG